jgi:putative transcriptional regulator
MKNGTGGIDTRTIERLCAVLDCQPGDIMEYVPDEQVENKGD